MTVTVPDDWARKFALFDQAEVVLYERWRGEGVSRAAILRCFASHAAIDSPMRDPAFLVWAGVRGCTQSGDWFQRFQRWGDLIGDARRADVPAPRLAGAIMPGTVIPPVAFVPGTTVPVIVNADDIVDDDDVELE